jgi:hypothetical protein
MSNPETNLADKMMEQLLAHDASRAEQRRALWAMSPAEREAAIWRGELAGTQLWEWARRCPDEVPQINGEWAFIALQTPEIAELNQPTSPTEPAAPPTRSSRPRRSRSNDETDLDLSR